VLCQTRPVEELGVLLAEAEEQLEHMCNDLSPTCSWPRNTLHLLGLLQDAFAPRLQLVPATISEYIDRIVTYGSKSPSGVDRKWAMEVAGCATESTLIVLLRDAISSGSSWLEGVAYKQASHLRGVPDDVAGWIRQSLLDSARTGRLLRERYSTVAFLKRLPQPHDFLSVARLLLWAPAVDLALLVGMWISISSHNVFHPLRALSFFFLPVIVIPFATLWCPFHRIPILIWGRGTGTRQAFDPPTIALIVMARCVALFSVFYGSSVVGNVISGLRHRDISDSANVWAPQRFHASIHPVLASLTIYGLLWGTTAVWSAAYGDFTALPWWPLQPLRPVLHFTNNTKARINGLLAFLRSRHFRVVLGMAMCVGLGLYIVSRLLQRYEKLIPSVFVGFSGLIVLTFITLAMHDWALIIRWRNRTDRAMTVRSLLEYASRLFIDAMRVSLIRWVRTGGHLIVQEGQKELLEEFVNFLWQRPHQVKAGSSTMIGEVEKGELFAKRLAGC
jgi:hypothetical protein